MDTLKILTIAVLGAAFYVLFRHMRIDFGRVNDAIPYSRCNFICDGNVGVDRTCGIQLSADYTGMCYGVTPATVEPGFDGANFSALASGYPQPMCNGCNFSTTSYGIMCVYAPPRRAPALRIWGLETLCCHRTLVPVSCNLPTDAAL